MAGRHRQRAGTPLDALTDSVLASVEHQLHLAATLGAKPHWRLHLSEATAEFATTRGPILAKLYPIGTFDRQKWTWAWADPRISHERCDAANQVKAFGMVHDISVFASPVVSMGQDPSADTAHDIITSTKVIHRLWHHFAFPMPGGAVLYTALDIPLQLPKATPGAIAQTLRTSTEQFTISKKHRALLSYANIRSLTHQEHRTESKMRLLTDTGAVQVGWSPDAQDYSLSPENPVHTSLKG